MSITREQVADLRPGDVVELRWDCYPDVTVSGPLYPRGGGQWVGPVPVIRPTGELHNEITLTVVSRAPRPLYVNHPRTEVKQHDVIRDGEGVIRHCDAAGFGGLPTWWSWNYEPGWKWTHTTCPPQPLTLLVDGTTGQAVQ